MMIFIRFIVTRTLKFLRFVGVAFIACVVFSCEEFCEESNRTAIVVNFYVEDAEEAVRVRIRGIENDSVLYPAASYRQVLLPVNPGADEMTFSFEKDDLPADTVVFRYTRHAGFISVECGCASFAQLHEAVLEATEPPSIVDVEITNPSVKTVSYRSGVVNAENIRIYY